MKAHSEAMKRTALGGMVLCAFGIGTAGAASLPKEGNYNFTACWSGVASEIEFGKTYKASSYEMTGTGKFEGMVASGTVKPMPPFPVVKPGTFQSCNHQSGTYRLK